MNLIRLRNNLTLEQLADETGYTKSYLSRIENDVRPLTKEIIKTLMNPLKLKMDDIKLLNEAVLNTAPTLVIKMTGAKPCQKELAVTFVRKLNELSPKKCKKIIAILNNQGG